MLTVNRMPDSVSVRLGSLVEPTVLVSPDRTSAQANDAAVELLGKDWRAAVVALVVQTSFQNPNGHWRHKVLSVSSPRPTRQYAVHATSCHDGSQIVLLEEAVASDLRPSRLLEEILESVSDCFFALSSDGIFVYANSQAAEYMGTTREGLLGQNLLSMSTFNSQFNEAYSKTVHDGVAVSYDARAADNDRWIEIRAYPVDGGMACYFADITDRISSQERIAFLALHDSLTRLPNRRYLQEELIRAVARGRRGQYSTLIFMDVDRFKLVNDTVGHAAGDAVLLEFAGVVASCVREEDMLARFGGDEFALLLGGTSVEDAMIAGDRIHTPVCEHEFRFGEHSFSLGVSIGMTVVDGTLDEGHVMALADDAMYESKTFGGDTVHFRSPSAKSDAEPAG